MAASSFENSLPVSNRVLSGRLASVLLVLSLAYVGAAMIRSPGIGAMTQGLLFPLKLFLLASAPTLGGLAFLWSDRAITDVRRRSLLRVALVLVLALAGMLVVSQLS